MSALDEMSIGDSFDLGTLLQDEGQALTTADIVDILQATGVDAVSAVVFHSSSIPDCESNYWLLAISLENGASFVRTFEDENDALYLINCLYDAGLL